MKQLDIFGKETDISLLVHTIDIKPKDRTIKGKFRSYFGFYKDHKCKECQHHIVLHSNNKKFHKCRMIGISNSSATDILSKTERTKSMIFQYVHSEIY